MFMRSSFCLVSVFWGVRVCYSENGSRTLWDFDTWTNLIWWLTFTDDNSILGWEASSMCLCWHNPMASSIFSLANPLLATFRPLPLNFCLMANWWPVVLCALHYGMFWWLWAPIFHFKFDLVFGFSVFAFEMKQNNRVIRIGLEWKFEMLLYYTSCM